MAAFQSGSKCSHTSVYAPLLIRSAPCPEPLSTIFEIGSIYQYVLKLNNTLVI
jgi:hypothetical protein